MNKAAAPLVMSAGQLGSLEVLARSSTAAHRAVQRARVLVLAADGVANAKIAAGVGVTPVTVRAWRDRFAREGLAKFARVRAGRGRKPLISADKIEEIIRLTQHETPAGATHWSCRSMAKRVGVSPATVQRIWSGRGLKPHLLKTFKLSNDPRFEDKLIDVVGLYLNPPEHAVVLCMDEKTSIGGPRPHPAIASTDQRPGGHDHERLQAARHDHPLRCPQCPRWHRDRFVYGQASSRRVR
jgi:transposase